MTAGHSSYGTNRFQQIFASVVDEEKLCDSYKKLAIASPRQEEEEEAVDELATIVRFVNTLPRHCIPFMTRRTNRSPIFEN